MITKGHSTAEQGTAIRRKMLSTVLVALRICLLLLVLAVGVLGYRAWNTMSTFPTLVTAGPKEGARAASITYPVAAEKKRVGIVAGHWQSDSGAVCSDGLQEVDITLEVAQQVVQMLQRLGYDAEILPEFSDKLLGYEADAFLSIHADSCLGDRSGFKVARMTQSAVPDEEDQLVKCLYEEYEKITHLQRDEATITDDMRQYHALRKIAPRTPGAIIEIGFMGGDRRLLTRQQSRVVRGIAAGLVRFLSGSP